MTDKELAEKERKKAYQKEYYKKHKEKIDASNKAYYEKNKEIINAYKLRWQHEHKEQKAEYELQRYLNNREKAAQARKEWRAEYPWRANALTAKRRAAKLQQTPKWLSPTDYFEIECIYAYSSALNASGLAYHVDHIVPIQGKEARGLHVPWNLQVIPASENISKSNKILV
jgi:hypothetical protein